MSKEKQAMVLRAYVLYFGFVAVLLIGLYKTFALQQVVSDAELPVRTVDKIPRKGEILDANLVPLVTSVAYFDIYMDPSVVDKEVFDAQVSDLAQGLNRLFPDKEARGFENEIREAYAKKSRYLLIRKKVTNVQRNAIRKLPIFKLGKIKGGLIDHEVHIERKAPNGDLLRRTLGYYRPDLNLSVGVEGAFHTYLDGVVGREVEHHVSGKWRKTGKLVKEPEDGSDVVTTFDRDIQEVAHSELAQQLKKMGAESGTAILMEVATGHIKAMVNLTLEKDGSYTESFNYAIGLREVPGSTFKLATLMAGLEDNKFNINDKVNAIGSYKIFNETFHDANDGRGYGTITLQQAFEKSSNVIALKTHQAYGKEPQKFMDRLQQFGLTEPLGIELPGELGPRFYRPGDEGWSKVSIPSMGIGYEYQQTPLHTCAFYNAVANNGKFLRPLFVKEIRKNGKVVKSFDAVVIREKICSDRTLKIMQSCLEGVVLRGTGKKLASKEFAIAGKTGTAKLPDKENRQYLDEEFSDYQASFVGYFPADQPKYTCLVLVTRPKTKTYAAEVEGPVFLAIANKIYATDFKNHPAVNEGRPKVQDVPIVQAGNRADLSQLFSLFGLQGSFNSSGPWVRGIGGTEKLLFEGQNFIKDKVPDVRGLSASDAIYLLESQGLSVRIIGAGQVFSQSLTPGSDFQVGQVIKIELK